MSARPLTTGVAILAAALTALLLQPAQPVHAQAPSYDVRGVVADSAGTPVQGAMVVALALPDSILTKFSLTDGNGRFSMTRLPAGSYLLQVTMVGYQTSRTDFALTNADLDAGTVRLSILALEMDPLVVSVEHVPFINKADTLSFNVLAFPTPVSAMVEDLLRRLPGFEVDDDGSIRAMGKDVKNVLVDGKEFFGSDPTIATRSLPADAVERVDVYDKKSDLAEFTGVPDGQEERTVDLGLREEAKRGYFGRGASGLGADQGAGATLAKAADEGVRYNQTFTLNRFDPTTQLALIANANNTNQAKFSAADLASVTGGGRGNVGGGRNDGFTETLSLGANASHDFADKSWIRSSYFFSNLNNLRDQTIQQQQLLGSEVASSSAQASNQTTENLGHRLNLNAQYTIADGHDLRLRGNLDKSSSDLTTLGAQETRTPDGAILNTASTNYVVGSDQLGGNANLTWRKRLNDGGSALVAELRANLNEPDLTANLSNTIGRPGRGDVLTYDEIVQLQQTTGRTLGQSQRLSLTQPLGTGKILELFGQRNTVDEDKSKSIYDLRSGAPVLNDRLSSQFERTYTYLRGGLRFNRNTEDVLFVTGLQVQGSDLNGLIVDRDETITKAYTHVLPNARFRYTWRPGWTVDVRYATSTREPTLQELQPFADNSNPLRVYAGNPDLDPEYRHNVTAEYRHFDQFSFTNLYAYVRGTYVTDPIVQSRTVDAQGLQEVTPVNVGNGWSTNLGASYDTPIRPIGAKVNLAYDLTRSRSLELVNQAENESDITRHSARVRLENRHKDIVDVAVGGNVTWNSVDYSLNEELNQSYVNSTLFANATWYYGTDWNLSSSLNYRRFDKDVFGPGQNVALLNATVSRYVAGQRGEIQLAAYDLLDQNQGVTFNSTSSAITESRVQSLGQYVMLRFVWRLGMAGGRFGKRMPRK